MGSIRQLLRFQATPPDIERLRERKDIGQLTRLLQYPDFTVQWKAAEALGTLGTQAVDHLLNALLEHDLPGKLGAIEALAGIKDLRAVTPLINLLEYDKHSEIQWACAIALGEIGDPAAIGPLRDSLMNPDKYVRFGAAVALRHLGWLPDTPEERTWQLIALQEWLLLWGFLLPSTHLLLAAGELQTQLALLWLPVSPAFGASCSPPSFLQSLS